MFMMREFTKDTGQMTYQTVTEEKYTYQDRFSRETGRMINGMGTVQYCFLVEVYILDNGKKIKDTAREWKYLLMETVIMENMSWTRWKEMELAC